MIPGNHQMICIILKLEQENLMLSIVSKIPKFHLKLRELESKHRK